MEQDLDTAALYQVLGRFEPTRDSCLPLLQAVQEEFGYIPMATILPVARYLGVFPSELLGMITFYAQFTTTPRGRNVVRVCRGTACHVRGGRTVFQTVRKYTGLEEGQTSEDMRFTLETVACLGACALSPVMVANKVYYGKLNPGRIEALLDKLP